MDASVLSRQYKSKNADKDFKFQTFTTKKIENLIKKCEYLESDSNLEHPVIEYGAVNRLRSFSHHTDDYRKSLNERSSIVNDFYSTFNKSKKISK